MTELKSANRIGVDDDFVTDTLSEYPDYLQSKEHFIKLAGWYAEQWKALDDEVVKLGYLRLLDNATGVLLDNIGSFLGVDRYDQADDSFRGRIKLRSLRQTTDGTRDEIINLLTIIFGGESPRVFKGDHGFVELTIPASCLSRSTLSEELEDLFPISTNLWLLERRTGKPFNLVDSKDNVQPVGTGGLSDSKLGEDGAESVLSDWIHCSAKPLKF